MITVRAHTKRIGVIVVMFSLLILAAGTQAQALTLYSFKGKVTDALGRALAGATVSDGSQSTSTAGDGSYSLPESSTGTFTLRASRADTNQVSKAVTVTVPVNTTVNFTLAYLISGVLARSYVSTANGSASDLLSITSAAPNPGVPGQTGGASCVSVTDSRTGTTSPATYVSGSTWSFDLSLAQSTTEGTYNLALVAQDCATSTTLSVTPAPNTPYLVDNTPPTIPAWGLLPLGHGNTVYTAQPLSAQTWDTGSGVDASTITFTLSDLTAGGGPVAYPSVAYSSNDAKTTSVSLTPGHVYSMAVSVGDRAGNVASLDQGSQLSQGFLVVTASVDPLTTQVEKVNGSVNTSHLNSDGTYTATFTNVPVDVAGTTVTLSGTQHAGIGYVDTTASLQSVKVCSTVSNLLCQNAFNSADVAWNPRLITSQFGTDNISSSSQAIQVMPTNGITIGTLTAHVPVSYGQNVYLTQTPVTVQPVFPTCTAPTDSSGYAWCGSDPLRFFVPDGLAASRTAEESRMRTDLLGNDCAGTCATTMSGTQQTSRLQYIVVTTVNGAAVFVPNPCPSPTQPGVVSCAGITYPSTYVSIAPVQYAQTCQSLPGQCSVDGQSDSANPCSPGSNCAPQECQGPDGQCYVVNNWTTEWDHFGQNPSGSQTQYQFLTGAITFTCFGNCRQWQPGWRDYYHVDGSKDGVAMNWGNGPSGMDYESAEVAIFDDASHPGTSTCSHPRGDSYASWYQVTGQYPVSHNGPWGAISMAQGTETLGMQYQNADSYGCDGSPSFRFAWSWGVLADMYGNWNASNSTTLYATYEHVHTQTNWQWSFTYGPPSASPTPTTYADTFIAPTTTYRY